MAFAEPIAGGPANDLCAQSLPILDGVTAYNTTGALTDGDPEPSCQFGSNDNQINQDIWYDYQATCTGDLTVSLCASPAIPPGYDTKVAVYLGSSCMPAADPLACDDDGCEGSPNLLASVVNLRVQLGLRYKIRIGGFEDEEGAGTMNITCVSDRPACINGTGDCCAAHANPGCSDAECCELVCASNSACCDGTWSADCVNLARSVCELCGGTGEDCEVCLPLSTGVLIRGSTTGRMGNRVGPCDGFNAGSNPDVWHCWTADCTGSATVSMCGSSYDTTLEVWDACQGTRIICNDDGGCPSPGVFSSRTQFEAVAGRTYRFRVAGYTGDSGNYSLIVTCAMGPANDRCVNAESIGVGSHPFTTINAGRDGPNLPEQCDEGSSPVIDHDVWYDFLAPCTGVALFSTCDAATFDTRLALYEGCECPVSENGVVGCNDDAPACDDYSSEMSARVTEDTCYKVRVGGYEQEGFGESGTGILTVTCDPPAPNDLCADAPVETLPHTFTGNNAHAASDCTELSEAQVWIAFELNAPSDVTLDYCGTNPPFESSWRNLALSCPCDAFSPDAAGCFICPDGNPMLKWFCLPAGTYYYPVLSEPGARGPYTIHVSASPCANNNSCAAALPIFDGDTLISTVGATTDGPALPNSCDEGGGLSFARDVWFNYQATCTGQAVFSTSCGQVDYDSRLALYSGSACPVTNDRLVGCDDDSQECGDLTSQIEVDVVAGQAYKLRVGGPGLAAGTGCLRTECGGTPNCPEISVSFVDPAPGSIDARQDGPLNGGGIEGIQEFVILAPPGLSASCFEVCETSTGGLPLNKVEALTALGGGLSALRLARPLTPGEVTVISYLETSVEFVAHAANVNMDGEVDALDFAALLACLQNPAGGGCGPLRTDMDRSELLRVLDLLRLVDLFNGANGTVSWVGTDLPTNAGVCP